MAALVLGIEFLHYSNVTGEPMTLQNCDFHSNTAVQSVSSPACRQQLGLAGQCACVGEPQFAGAILLKKTTQWRPASYSPEHSMCWHTGSGLDRGDLVRLPLRAAGRGAGVD